MWGKAIDIYGIIGIGLWCAELKLGKIRLGVYCGSLSKIEHRSYVVRGTNMDMVPGIIVVESA